MSPTRGPLEQSSLFDLELGGGASVEDEVAGEAASVEPVDPSEADTLAHSQPREEVSEPEIDREATPSRLALLYAGAVDGAVHGAVVLVLLVGLRFLGIVVGGRELPALVLLLAIFSLFYHVIPLAFWGRTLGLEVAGLRVTSDGGELTLSQATRRWLASCLVVLLCGLPWLLLPTGRSFADRLSRTAAELF